MCTEAERIIDNANLRDEGRYTFLLISMKMDPKFKVESLNNFNYKPYVSSERYRFSDIGLTRNVFPYILGGY
jgi:hypothetical protein